MLSSCSSDDDITDDDSTKETTDGTTINPPSWIQGEWVLEGTEMMLFKFTEDNLCQGTSSSGVTSMCFKGQLEQYDMYKVVVSNEEISNNKYSITFNYYNGVSFIEFNFKKVSDTQIYYVQDYPLSDMLLTKK